MKSSWPPKSLGYVGSRRQSGDLVFTLNRALARNNGNASTLNRSFRF